jgi:hypothetical protein
MGRFHQILIIAAGLFFAVGAQANTYYLTNGIAVKYGQHGQNMASCYSCKTCHATIVPDPSNPQVTQFGNAWLAAWKVREPGRATDAQIDTQALMAFDDIASADADGDGQTNVTEINADANPNDPSSVPGNTGCNLTSGSGGGGNTAFTGNLANANMLNAKCGFSGAGMITTKTDPVHVVFNGLLYLLPILFAFALKRRVVKTA